MTFWLLRVIVRVVSVAEIDVNAPLYDVGVEDEYSNKEGDDKESPGLTINGWRYVYDTITYGKIIHRVTSFVAVNDTDEFTDFMLNEKDS